MPKPRGGRRPNVEELEARVAELEEILRAIRGGEVDALVVEGPFGDQIYTVTNADQPYRIFVESMQEGAVTASGEGDILFCNRRFADMVRTPLQRVIGTSLRRFIDPACLPALDRLLDGRSGKEQAVLVTDEGATLPVSVAASKFAIEDLSVTCIVVTDLTEQKVQEERTAHLTREMAARAQAEEQNRTKDDFLAVLSHELRTPLSAMLGWVRMLRTAAIDEARRAHGLDVIERNVRHQTQLITDLLDVSRIVTGKLSLDAEPVELAPVVGAVVETFRPIAAVKQLEIAAVMTAVDATVLGDRERLHQVFGNLLSNAVKFTPPAGSITVTLEASEGYARVTVRDNGQGIAPAFLPHIFERFRQGDASSTRTSGGLGLGLTIARHLVDCHGGTIAAASAGQGHGATFTVALPLLTYAHRQRATPPTEPMPPVEGVRVLLVDDHVDTLDVLSAVLRESGMTVSTADSAPLAIEMLTAGGADVVVCDISMPGEDGLSLITRIRAAGVMALPAIALSAYAGPQDRQRALAAGFNLHLAKPVEPADLVNAIGGVLGAKATTRDR